MRHPSASLLLGYVTSALWVAACSKDATLETGAEIIQEKLPVDQISMHLVGFHPLRDQPQHGMQAHHFCNVVNDDFIQCVIFDGDGEDARLNGVEYIVSGKSFQTLPAEERQFWHPHNHEVLSGQLVLPGIPTRVEHEVMEKLLNSYGKTWHLWNTGSLQDPKQDPLPLGPPRLAWSYNAEHDSRRSSSQSATGATAWTRPRSAAIASPSPGAPSVRRAWTCWRRRSRDGSACQASAPPRSDGVGLVS